MVKNTYCNLFANCNLFLLMLKYFLLRYYFDITCRNLCLLLRIGEETRQLARRNRQSAEPSGNLYK